jgi:hypothetical protein
MQYARYANNHRPHLPLRTYRPQIHSPALPLDNLEDEFGDPVFGDEARVRREEIDSAMRRDRNLPPQYCYQWYRAFAHAPQDEKQNQGDIYQDVIPIRGGSWCVLGSRDACSSHECKTWSYTFSYTAQKFLLHGPWFDADAQVRATPAMSALQCFMNSGVYTDTVTGHLTRLATTSLLNFCSSHRPVEFMLKRFRTLLSFANEVLASSASYPHDFIELIHYRYWVPNLRVIRLLLSHLHIMRFSMAHVQHLGGDVTHMRQSFSCWVLIFQSVCLLRVNNSEEVGALYRPRFTSIVPPEQDEGDYKKMALKTGLHRVIKNAAHFESLPELERNQQTFILQSIRPLMLLAGHSLSVQVSFDRVYDYTEQIWEGIRGRGADYSRYVTLGMRNRPPYTDPYVWSLQPVGTRVLLSPMSLASSYGNTQTLCAYQMPATVPQPQGEFIVQRPVPPPQEIAQLQRNVTLRTFTHPVVPQAPPEPAVPDPAVPQAPAAQQDPALPQ